MDGSALVIFDGGAAQQIINTSGVANGSIFANIRISNTSGDVTLVSNSATATASLDFTSGKLILGTNNFTLGLAASSGVLSGNSSSLYVVTNSTGYFQRYAASGVATQYPVGISTASGQNLATLTPGDNSTFQVLVDASVTTPNVAARVVNAEWTITRTGGAAATTIKLGWTAGTTTGASFNINDARVVIGRYVGGGSVWNETTNSAKTTADPFDVTATGFTSFSPFAVGSGTAPLPVDLLFFTAKYIQPVSVIEWATASEKNSNSFSVERSSDNSYFEEIGSVTAKGNSSEQNNYSFTDKTPLSGISYYRLKQYDTDGSFTYSKTVSIEVKGKTIEIRKIFPNPMGGETYLDIFSAEETPIQINLINQSGENVQTQKFNLIKGDNLLIMDVNDIGPGIYFIKTDKTDVEKGGNLKKVSVMER
ncbi:MAG: hypothetical protein A3H98_12855 [Bacteroidetes bacterium RIFCSPLOWO2_02_FULL_36_8]|nr:MAG: hypothetical protein A3H98_12855 [Bacteroidetes bacterium RIFCSPLOWO2_02_FULL_36_8]